MIEYTDADTVRYVQSRLKELGYVDISEVDGKLGDITLDEIVAFRRRNSLPLAAAIDDQFLDALEIAPEKELPMRVINASAASIENRVAAAATVAETRVQSWWSKFWAWIAGVPALALALLQAIVSNFGDAVNALQPVRAFLSEVPVGYWLAGFGAVALILGIQAMRTERLAKEAQNQMVEGYQKGTVKNDAEVGTGVPTAAQQEQENQDAKLS